MFVCYENLAPKHSGRGSDFVSNYGLTWFEKGDVKHINFCIQLEEIVSINNDILL